MPDQDTSPSRPASTELQSQDASATTGIRYPDTTSARTSIRVLRQIATTRRRSEAVGRVAERLLALVDAASTMDDAPGTTDGVVVAHPSMVGRRAQVRRDRRVNALNVLMGRDAAGNSEMAGAEIPLKTIPASLLSQTLSVALQAVRLAQELGDKASSLDIERAAALASATARASKAGELDARAEAAAKAKDRAWERPAQHSPHDGSPGPGPSRLFNSVDRDPDVLDPRDDPMHAYLTVEPEIPEDLPEAPDPSVPQPIDRSGSLAGGE